jgi:hypothetical protein
VRKIKEDSKQPRLLTKATPHAGFSRIRWTIRRSNFSTYGQESGTQSRTGLSLDR